MADSAVATEPQSCFQFKTSFSPCTIMQITRYDADEIEQQLKTTISRAPNFFIGSAVVIDLELVKSLHTIDFARIKHILLTNNMIPVGARGGTPEQHTEAATAGIPIISIGKGKAANNTPTKKTQPQSTQRTKLVTTPIRSGMQVYAKDADLIVVAPVSAGAELLADGNIHVYGPLRGRALAGVQGDSHARIFCRTLEAELVAIAGYYLVKEDIQKLPREQSTVQVYLTNGEVKIETV